MHTDTHTPYQGEEQPGFQESFSMFLCLAIVFCQISLLSLV